MSITYDEASKLQQKISKDIKSQKISRRRPDLTKLRKHNAATLINSKIPPELLSYIFLCFIRNSFYQDNYLPERDPGTAEDVWSWIHITFVCSHWRSVAISCPDIWSVIYTDTDAPSCTRAFLDRSKDAKLYISGCTNGDEEEPLESLRMCLEQMHRIKELSIGFQYLESSEPFSWMTRPAPLLTFVGVSLNCSKYQNLPDNFLGKHAPLVRSLSVSACGIPWTTNLISSQIREIHMSNASRTKENTLPPFSEFMDSLRRTPHIEHLSLYGDPAHSPSSHESFGMLPLLHLKRLKVTASLSFIVSFFANFDIPLSTHLEDIDTISLDESSSGLTYRDLLPVLYRFCRSPTGIHIWALNVLSLSLWDTPDALGKRPKFSTTILPTYYGLNTSQNTIADWVWENTTLDSVEKLYLSDICLSCERWTRLLQRMQVLRRLHVTEHSCRALVSALKDNMDLVPPMSSKQKRRQKRQVVPLDDLLLPTLEDLELSYIMDDPDNNEPLIEDLVHVLKGRSEMDRRVKTVCLNNCGNASKAQLRILRKCVDELTYQGLSRT